jgi:hypothetical protein
MRDSTQTDRQRGPAGRDSSGNGEGSRHRHDPDDGRAHGKVPKRLSGNKAVQVARQYLESLTGQPAEAVSGLMRTRDGWAVTLEVVELERVPSSTDILGSYRVEVDNEGELLGYDRLHRYYRNQAGGE